VKQGSRQATAIGAHPGGWPVATLAVLGLLAASFAAEIAFPVKPPRPGWLAPHISTMVAMGGMTRALVVESREYWRLIACAMLHVDGLHLLLNGVPLLMAGAVLEELVGRAWLVALFVAGVLGGSLLALAADPTDTVTVGASGGILALLFAAIVSTQRLTDERARRSARMPLVVVLLPSLLPLVTHRTGGRIDWASHIGGVLVGAGGGLLLLRSWPADQPVARHHRVVAAVAAIAVAALAACVVLAAAHYGSYRAALAGK
jgi:rhomboid protease GluP